MEATQSNIANDKKVRVLHHIDRVNLYDYGYEKSGSAKGDPDVYVSYLNRILNGDLVEEPYKGFSDEEKKERFEQLKELEKQLKEKEDFNITVESEIKDKEKDIDKYRKDLLHIREARAQDHQKLKSENFSVVKFTLNLFILSMLSIYLFFFYISATYKALYVDFEGIAERIARGEGTGSIMPGPYELADALQYNYLLLVVPFVFYAFGWAFHVILESKTDFKTVFLTALITVTFIVDFLLAMIISNNTESAKALMGLATIHWYQSPSFYIILFLGFLVYIIWSILLDSLLREWDKREITNNLKKIIRHLQGDSKALKARLQDFSHLKSRIADYRDDVSAVMQGNLKRYIDQFSSGWIAYLAPANLKEAKEKCLALKKEFEEKNSIKNGVVKVISKRLLNL
ncbi:MAG TPA: hypothetical protein VFU05_09730 [Cyclobacteriaceae bacterium]|nr:hypothetical protein [Cyclobacteriaceae bacterium]